MEDFDLFSEGPLSDEIENRWLVDLSKLDMASDEFKPEWGEMTIVQTGLTHPTANMHRVRKIVDDHLAPPKFTRTVKLPTGDMAFRKEFEENITYIQYRDYLENWTHPDQVTIVKTRRVFVWGEFIWELDIFHQPVSNLAILECEIDRDWFEEHGGIDPPDFIPIIREITYEPGWTNAEIGTKGWVRPDER